MRVGLGGCLGCGDVRAHSGWVAVMRHARGCGDERAPWELGPVCWVCVSWRVGCGCSGVCTFVWVCVVRRVFVVGFGGAGAWGVGGGSRSGLGWCVVEEDFGAAC